METKNNLNPAEFEINICGRCMDIPTIGYGRLYLLFITGSGYGGQSRDYYGSSEYGVYELDKKTFGKQLNLVGKATENQMPEGTLTTLTVNGKTYDFPFSIDNIMNKIYRKN
jgi:hypothetical protein